MDSFTPVAEKVGGRFRARLGVQFKKVVVGGAETTKDAPTLGTGLLGYSQNFPPCATTMQIRCQAQE